MKDYCVGGFDAIGRLLTFKYRSSENLNKWVEKQEQMLLGRLTAVNISPWSEACVKMLANPFFTIGSGCGTDSISLSQNDSVSLQQRVIPNQDSSRSPLSCDECLSWGEASARRATGWFDGCKNDVNLMKWSSVSPLRLRTTYGITGCLAQILIRKYNTSDVSVGLAEVEKWCSLSAGLKTEGQFSCNLRFFPPITDSWMFISKSENKPALARQKRH